MLPTAIQGLTNKDIAVGLEALWIQTGFAAADFSRIRDADLSRFTVDRLMTILNSLGSRVEVSVQVKQREIAPTPHI